MAGKKPRKIAAKIPRGDRRRFNRRRILPIQHSNGADRKLAHFA